MGHLQVFDTGQDVVEMLINRLLEVRQKRDKGGFSSVASRAVPRGSGLSFFFGPGCGLCNAEVAQLTDDFHSVWLAQKDDWLEPDSHRPTTVVQTANG